MHLCGQSCILIRIVWRNEVGQAERLNNDTEVFMGEACVENGTPLT